MTDQLPADLITSKEELHSTEAAIWIAEICLTDKTALCLARNTANVTWPSAGGRIFYAYDFDFDAIHMSSDDQHRAMSAETSRADTELIALFEEHNGFNGKKVILRQVFLDNLDETDVPTVEYKIRGVSESVSGGTKWTLGELDLEERQEPHRFFDPAFCPYAFGGFRCGFDCFRPDATTYCDKSLDGSDGCKSRGRWESENGYPVLHPKRFGGFPGIQADRQ